MAGKYSIIYNIEENFYKENSPVIIQAGALVKNNENDSLHAQVKFLSVSDKRIVLLKAKFILCDAVGRIIGEIEKQYLDLSANYMEQFGAKVVVPITTLTVRRISVQVSEVCFEDNSVWTDDDTEWTSIPNPQTLNEIYDEDAITEFSIAYCSNSCYIPQKHKDLWICSCGNINHERFEFCATCGAKYELMANLTEERLHNNRKLRIANGLIESSDFNDVKKALSLYKEVGAFDNSDELFYEKSYDKACELVAKRDSQSILMGIALLRDIEQYKDSLDLIVQAEDFLIVVREEEAEKEEQRKKAEKKSKKRVMIASICAIVAVVFAVAGVVASRVISEQDLIARGMCEMELSNDGSYYIVTGLAQEDVREINIPATYKETSVCEIADRAFFDKNITSITIPKTVEKIGESAFSDCKYLKTVTIEPNNNMAKIGKSAFYKCVVLEEINLQDTKLSSIEDSAFYQTALKKVVLPNSVKQIKKSAFYDCDMLTRVTFSNSLTRIGDAAFKSCEKLSSVSLPDTVISIGNESFYDCSKLTLLELGGTKRIGVSAFQDCVRLTSLQLANVSGISENAFRNCSSLMTVDMSRDIEYIDAAAFYGCDDLENLYFSGDLENWLYIDFYNPTSNPLYYAKELYFGTSLVTEIIIPSNISNINRYAFYNCTSLELAKIPSSVTNIGEEAFACCKNLTIYCAATSRPSGWDYSWNGSYSSDRCTVVWDTVDIGTTADGIKWSQTGSNTVEIIGYTGSDAFVEIPSTINNVPVTTIGSRAFLNNTTITAVEIGDGVQTIESEAFKNSSIVVTIIPSSVTSINYSAFYNCDSFISVMIPSSVTYIGNDAFASCKNLTIYCAATSRPSGWDYSWNGSYSSDRCTVVWDTIAVGTTSDGLIWRKMSNNNVEIVGYTGNSSAITIPKSISGARVTTIAGSAFYNNDNLGRVTISDSVESIGNNAFYDCDSLKSITYEGSVVQWKAITKGYSCLSYIPATYVQCDDGRVSI